MPTDTQRAPTVAQCIEREREAWDRAVTAGPPWQIRATLAAVDAARAATDEAVRAVEAAFRAMFRLFTGGDRLSHAEWRECTDTVAAYVRGGISTPAPTAQGESTGGEGDE